jgi:hypothetical protein
VKFDLGDVSGNMVLAGQGVEEELDFEVTTRQPARRPASLG